MLLLQREKHELVTGRFVIIFSIKWKILLSHLSWNQYSLERVKNSGENSLEQM